MCGIVGVISKSPVNQLIYDALLLLQHRGQDAAGIVTMQGTKCFMHKARGMVRDVFRTRNMRALPGNVGLGQVRYPTAGNAYSEEEAQPFYVNAPFGIVLVHNGNLTNAHALKAELFSTDHRHINTESDSEVLLNVLAHELERNTRELQERVMAVRMVPIGATFSRFPRLVRDLASTFGKKITLQTVGEETELDKGVVERIGDPLTHLIRNAIDHGIESPAERVAAGKPEEGHIVLRAFHEGGSVAVEIADDGGGLNTARIREKAIATGLLSPDADATDEQIHSLIFEPGFSTAQTVTDVSGRGVGMDVVRKNIEALGGSVTIQSERGRGTRFRIKLPLTLAILDGLLLRVGEETYIFPLVSIIESLRPSGANLRTVLGRGEVVIVRGEFVPLLRLHRIFETTGHVSNPTEGLVVLVENEGQKLGILADEILGQSQVVIKNLEANYRKVEGIMGATIMGDGRVALILDVQSLARLSERGRTGEASTNAQQTNAARSLTETTPMRTGSKGRASEAEASGAEAGAGAGVVMGGATA